MKETVAIPRNIYLRPCGRENRTAKQSKYEVDDPARDVGRGQSGTFWALLMLKCTGYAEGTTAIHARNSVRVAQTTAISPAAPAHRTAWNVTWYRGATSSNPGVKQNFVTLTRLKNQRTQKRKREYANICGGQTANMGKDNLMDCQLWSWGCASSYTLLISIHARTCMTSMNSRIPFFTFLQLCLHVWSSLSSQNRWSTRKKTLWLSGLGPCASARAKLKTPSLNATKARRTRRPNPWQNVPFLPVGFDQVWRVWPGLIGLTPKIFVSNKASLSFGSFFTNYFFCQDLPGLPIWRRLAGPECE